MTSDNQTRKIELLAPAGNFEKLEIAIHYGADAVYLAGQDFSLRNFSGNFSPEEMADAVKLAHSCGVKVYVACNIYSRNHEQEAVAAYLEYLKDIGPDALIIADPAIFMAARDIAPEIPVHISTQANTTNYNTIRFWEKLGAVRINTARELSLSEIREIREKSRMEIESFVHGAMCISHSGRCLLSSFMAGRDGNRGLCCHPCRFNYAVMEERRPGQYFPVMEDGRGTYIFNSRDLCMVAHIPEMIRAGIDSLKIEGRIKGINYLGSTVKTYRDAIDAWYENPEAWTVRPEWIDELNKTGHRGYCTGFYLGDPSQTVPNYQECVYDTPYLFVARVLENREPGQVRVAVRNKITTGDMLEILSPGRPLIRDRVQAIHDADGLSIPLAQPNTTAVLTLETACLPRDLIRKTVPE